ncbi:AAA family ATPase [Bacillus sp. RC252]|uniref:AAA family ATPase n=1 Tax=Bacillus sp. RC252 TaxID=3156289 RepID=UPI00383326BD
MKRDLTLKALKNEQLKLSVFSPKHFQKINRIEKIIDQHIPGITVLSGNRGVGKSTIMNYYLNQYKNKSNYLFFRFNLTNNNSNFFRDIFTYIQEIDLKTKEIDTEIKQRIESHIESLKEKIFFNIIHEEISDKEYALTKEFKDHSESSINIPFKLLAFKASISKNTSDKDIDRYKTKIIKTKNFYKDAVQNELIEILNLKSSCRLL